MKELWDLYDENRNLLDKKVYRGDILNDNEYHLVINAWIKNSQGKFLITQRSASRKFAFKWETTGGSALSGESSIEAAKREVLEELGIDITNVQGKLVGTAKRYYKGCPDFLDVWLFQTDVDINDVKIQEEEVNDVRWATKEEIKKLYRDGMFEANAFFEEAISS